MTPFRRVPPGGRARRAELAQLQRTLQAAAAPQGGTQALGAPGILAVPRPPSYLWARLTARQPTNRGATFSLPECEWYAWEELRFRHCASDVLNGVSMMALPSPSGQAPRWPAYEVNGCDVPTGTIVQLWRGNGDYFLFLKPNDCFGSGSGAAPGEESGSGSGAGGFEGCKLGWLNLDEFAPGGVPLPANAPPATLNFTITDFAQGPGCNCEGLPDLTGTTATLRRNYTLHITDCGSLDDCPLQAEDLYNGVSGWQFFYVGDLCIDDSLGTGVWIYFSAVVECDADRDCPVITFSVSTVNPATFCLTQDCIGVNSTTDSVDGDPCLRDTVDLLLRTDSAGCVLEVHLTE